jgi:hypothetical protein
MTTLRSLARSRADDRGGDSSKIGESETAGLSQAEEYAEAAFRRFQAAQVSESFKSELALQNQN